MLLLLILTIVALVGLGLGLATRQRHRAAPDLIAWLRAATGRHFRPVQNGKPLEDALYGCIAAHLSAVVLSMPGTGKTFNALAAARRAMRDGLVGSVIHIEGSRDWSADELLSQKLVIRKGKDKVGIEAPLLLRLLKKVVRELREAGAELTLDDAMPRIHDRELTDARRLWGKHKKLWVLVLVDEFTRISQTQIDRLLTILNDFKARVNGQDRYISAQFIFLGNPSGMDAGTGNLGHAFYSRISKWLAIRDVPLATSAELWAPKFLATVIEENATPAKCQPAAEYYWLVSAIRYLLWGTYDESRRGVHQLPDDAKRLLLELPKVDPLLGEMLKRIAALTTFGPDSRRVPRFLAAAMLAAQEEDAPFQDRHLLREAVTSLAVGAAVSFSPGMRPDLQIEYEMLIAGITERVLTNAAVRDVIARLSAPHTLAGPLAAGLFGAADAAARDAIRDALAAREISPRVFEFLRRSIALPAADEAETARRIASLASGVSNGERIVGDPLLTDRGEFVSADDRAALATLLDLGRDAGTRFGTAILTAGGTPQPVTVAFAGADAWPPLGKAVAILLMDGEQRRRVELAAEVKYHFLGTPVEAFAPLIADIVTGVPSARDAVADICAVVSTAFAADADTGAGAGAGAVDRELEARGFRSGTTIPRCDAHLLFTRLFAALRLRSKIRHFAVLEAAFLDLSRWEQS